MARISEILYDGINNLNPITACSYIVPTKTPITDTPDNGRKKNTQYWHISRMVKIIRPLQQYINVSPRC